MEVDKGDGLEVCRGGNITMIGGEEEDVKGALQSGTCAGWWDHLLRVAQGEARVGVHFWVCWFEVPFGYTYEDDKALECRGGWWERGLGVETVRAWEMILEPAARGEKQAQDWAQGPLECTHERHAEETARMSRENQERVVPQRQRDREFQGGYHGQTPGMATGMGQRKVHWFQQHGGY